MKILRSPISFALAFGLLLGLAVGALVSLLSAAPRGTPVQLQPAPTPAPIQVDVSGAVRQPGVYTLPINSRVQDAIQAAGGLSETASQEAVNLAAMLKDGEKLLIPEVRAPAAQANAPADVPVVPDPTSETGPSRSGAIDPATPVPTGPVNLNTASAELLQTLPGIGPTKAGDIIAYRDAHGGFRTIEELMDVKGIGPATFEKLKDKVIVE